MLSIQAITDVFHMFITLPAAVMVLVWAINKLIRG